MNKDKIIVLLLAGIVLIGLWLIIGSTAPVGNQYDLFAKCLAGKGVTMYGADWCSHCQTEKAAFGDSFKYVLYVECPENIPLCLEKKITGYPTWIFADGQRLEGEQGLINLARKSGCELIIN